MAIDGNLQYSKSALGNYLTTRKKDLQHIITAAFDADKDIALTDENTGAVVLVPVTTAASTITLPTAAAGLNFKLTCGANNAAHTITIAGTFKGSVVSASKFKIGDVISLVCDGTNWLVSGQLLTGTAVSVS
mgnify:CR=1 FL=1